MDSSPPRGNTPMRSNRWVWVSLGLFAVVCLLAGTIWLVNSKSPLESSFAGVRGEGPTKAALIQLQNVSDRQVDFRVFKVLFRYDRREWEINTPGIKIPRYVPPGKSVDFPVLLKTPEGETISGPVEIGIRYGTVKSTWVASLPAGMRSSIGSTFGTSEGKAVNGVQWTAFDAP